MPEYKLDRRSLFQGAAALAIASCTQGPTTSAPTATVPGAATTAPTISPKALVPFKWLFGFNVGAGATLPVIIARELGYYRDQGLDFAWDFTTDSTGIRLIGTNQYQAGSVSDSAAPVRFINEGVPLKAIALLTQVGARALAVKKGSGITRPKDFEGKKVGIKSTPWTEYLVMLGNDNVDRSKIEEIPVGFSSVELKDGIVDVLPVFRSNEPYALKTQLDTEVDLLLPEDWGYPPIGTSLVVNSNYIQSNPDEVTALLRATLKAGEFMVANKAESLQIAVQYGGTARTKEQLDFQFDITAADMVAGQAATKGIGWVTREQWQAQLDLLTEYKLVDKVPTVDTILDTSFLDKVLKDGKVVWP